MSRFRTAQTFCPAESVWKRALAASMLSIVLFVAESRESHAQCDAVQKLLPAGTPGWQAAGRFGYSVAVDGDDLGILVFLSLAPGDGELRESFFIGEDRAYVTVGQNCLMGPFGGGALTTLPDGREVSLSIASITFELVRQGGAWVVAGTFNSMIN